MTLGIAIPTYKKHLCHIEELLDSLENSTILPDMVSIGCSEVTTPLSLKNYSFEIVLTETSGYRAAGQNRNIAASKLNTDIISFIDSDDISTPFRNEYLIESFKNEAVKAVVHDFSVFSRTTGIIEDFIEISPMELKVNYLNIQKKNMSFPVNNKDEEVIRMACGHISIRREILNIFRYHESMKRTQDVEVIQRVVSKGIPLSYITNKLSYYRNDQ